MVTKITDAARKPAGPPTAVLECVYACWFSEEPTALSHHVRLVRGDCEVTVLLSDGRCCELTSTRELPDRWFEGPA